MRYQRCFGGVRLLGSGPSLKNVEKLDAGAMGMLSAMAARGLQVDLDIFRRMGQTLHEDMERITEEVHDLTGYYVNIDSGDQVADLLFRKMKLKQARPKLTKSGDRESVEDEVLTAIQHDHPVIPKMLDYKELSKLKGTYVDPMPRLTKKGPHGEPRLFPNFNQFRVPSGRYAAKAPNLLAMPTRTERGREIRKAFITDDGWVYVSVDFSQIEVRVAAHRSEDEHLCRVYFNQEDVYSDFATAAFNLPDKRYRDDKGKWHYPGVDKDKHRFPSKTCTLAAIYDVTPKGLLEQMPVMCAGCGKPATQHDCRTFTPLWTEEKCGGILASFYKRYPGLIRMRQLDHARARRNAYIWGLWGRLLHVAAVRSIHPWVAEAALREVGNFPMQEGATGCLKLAMAELWEDIETSGLQEEVYPLLPIHDELLFEVKADIAEEWAAHVENVFRNVVRLKVPIDAGSDFAQTWGDIKK
jgi:DNA polymerase-1